MVVTLTLRLSDGMAQINNGNLWFHSDSGNSVRHLSQGKRSFIWAAAHKPERCCCYVSSHCWLLQAAIYLSIHHGCHCWWCIISASHQVHVPFISNPASGVPTPSNPLHIEPCKPSFWFHQCGVPFGSPHWAADGNRSLCHFASTKNGSFTSFQSWQLHFYGCHTHKKLRRAGVTHSHIVHMGVLAMGKWIIAITNCKGLCVG